MHKSLSRIAAVLLNSPWAIQEGWLQDMYAIFMAHQDGVDVSELLPKREAFQELQNIDTDALKDRGYYRRGPVAVIPIQGPIFPKANLMTEFCGATSLELVSAATLAAEDDSDISHIVVAANSPGGSVTGVDEYAAVIRSLSKPIVGHVSGVGASAMYWLLSQMDEISVSPTSSVGSIGVIMSMTKYSKGSSEEYPKTLQFVSSVSPKKRLDPESKEGEAEILSMVNSIAEVFAKDVAAGRKVSLETVLGQFGQGGMLTGEAAVAAGMVDRVDTFEALLARLGSKSSSYSSHGETQMKRTEYKEKFPEEYNAIRAEGSAEVSATLTQVQIEARNLATENTRLAAENDAHAAKLKALEKESAIRAEKANQIMAENIFSDAFKASGIAPRLEPKVRRACETPEAFTKDGVFDAEAYKSSVTAEIGDWAKELGASAQQGGDDPLLKGLGASGVEGEEVDNDAKSDVLVNAMLAHINVTQ